MGLFDQFPYTNFHELNLMWILEALKEIQTTTEQFVAINSLKYANPIQWNIVKQYEKNTIVIDPLTGTAYISVQPVPTGVSLNNEDYWTVVFNLREFVVRAAKNFTTRFEEETTLTATFNTAAGEWLVWGDTLYVANVNITAGDSYIVDGNIKRITVEEVKDQIYNMTGDLADLDTQDKSNLVAAINEVLNTLGTTAGDLADLDTQDKSNLVTAINEVLNTLGTTAGDLADLDTQDKSNLVAAINEVLNTLGTTAGDLADLDTQDKSNLVAAINEALLSGSIYYDVTKHGADNTGVNDCLSIINDGINSGLPLYFPKGKYRITNTIHLGTGNSILGQAANDFNNTNGAIILIDNDSAHAIEIDQGAQFVTVNNITIDRILTGTPSGDGLHVNQGSNINISKVHSQNHNRGFYLSATGWSYIKDCISRKNFSHGFCYENTAISGALQWQTQNCLSELNDGTGFYMHGIENSFNVVTTGLFDGICTFNNKGYGVYVYGDTEGINAFRLTNAFLGNDNAGEIRLLPRGAVGGMIDNCYLEIAGFAGAGRNEDSTANVNACGIQIDDDSKDYVISNCHISSCQGDGIACRNDNTTITGCQVHNNGLSGYGVGIRQVLGKMIVTNNLVRDNPTSQIYFTSDTQSNVISNIVSSAILYAGGQTNINDAYNILIS